MIPASIDEKYDEPTNEHRWQRFDIRFKLLLFTLVQNLGQIPDVVYHFIANVTTGKLSIPPEFLLLFEKKKIEVSLAQNKERKLTNEEEFKQQQPTP